MTDEFAIKILEQYREKPTLINEIETVEEAVWLDEALAIGIKALEQEPFINKPCVSSGVCEHDKLKVLEKIREQIKSHLRGVEITLEVLVEGDPLRPKMEGAKDTLEECLELIDRAESEA